MPISLTEEQFIKEAIERINECQSLMGSLFQVHVDAPIGITGVFYKMIIDTQDRLHKSARYFDSMSKAFDK
jgi:hypothetical protein